MSGDAVIQEEDNGQQSAIYCNRDLQDTGGVMYSGVGQELEHLDRTYGHLCEAVWKKISGQTEGTGRPSRRFESAKTLDLQEFCSALGRTRTCGLLIRSQTLYPAELRAHQGCI